MKKFFTIINIVLFLSLAASQIHATGTTYEWIAKSNYAAYLNTTAHSVKIQYPKSDANKAKAIGDLEEVSSILLEIEHNFSISQTPIMQASGIAESLLMKINRLSGIEPVVVSDDFIELLESAIEIARITDGAFDPSVGPLTTLWNISGRSDVCDGFLIEACDDFCDAPSLESIQSALALVDYTKIEINEVEKTVYLPQTGMKLDLGGIAKGYAADKVIAHFVSEGYVSVVVSLGGNIHTYGYDYINNAKFGVEIRDPFSWLWYSRIGGLRVENQSVVTSGTYERYIIDDEGNRYHHLLNAKTGYPFDSDLVSVTIISSSSTIADALATGIYGLGMEEGLHLVESNDGIEVIFITENKNIYISNALKFTYDTELDSQGYTFHGVNFKDDSLLYPNRPQDPISPIVYIGISIAAVGVTVIGYAIYLALKKNSV